MTGELILPSHVRLPAGSRYRPAQRLRAATKLPRQSDLTLTDRFEQRSFRPQQPIFLFDQHGRVTTILMPMGETEVSELDDLIQAQRERTPFDFDEWRARNGYPSREKAGALMAEAIERRIQQHKQNPVTDPFRVPQYSDRTPNIPLPDRPWRSEK